MVEQRIQGGGGIPFKGLFGFGAVEEYLFNRWIVGQQAAKVIRDDGAIIDIGVEAGGSGAGSDDVPEADPVGQKDLKPSFVVELKVRTNDLAHDMPESVSRMGIILRFR